MTAWPEDELSEIVESDDLHIAPFREDGETYGTPTWIWSVAVDDAPLRACLQRPGLQLVSGRSPRKRGPNRGCRHDEGGHIRAVNGSINDRIDDAYREKYEGSSYLSAMISERARSATVKIMPRDTDA